RARAAPAASAGAARRGCRGAVGPAARAPRAWRSPRAPARGAPRCVPGRPSLAEDHGMRAAVPRPAGLVLLVAERQLLPVADGGHALGGDALPDQPVLHGLRPLRAEGEVVLDGAAAVGVT